MALLRGQSTIPSNPAISLAFPRFQKKREVSDIT